MISPSITCHAPKLAFNKDRGEQHDSVTATSAMPLGATTGWSTPPAADMVAHSGTSREVLDASGWREDRQFVTSTAGWTAVRLMLIVDDPDTVFDQAVALARRFGPHAGPRPPSCVSGRRISIIDANAGSRTVLMAVEIYRSKPMDLHCIIR